MGRKHEPGFRLVLTDSKNSTKSGRFAEVLGSYDPRKTREALKIDRIKHWLSQGAGLTGSVNNLLIRKGIIRGKKTHVGSDFVEKAKEAPVPVAEAPVAEVPVETPVKTPAAEEVKETPQEPSPEV